VRKCCKWKEYFINRNYIVVKLVSYFTWLACCIIFIYLERIGRSHLMLIAVVAVGYVNVGVLLSRW
jgi:hypothetical protein